LLPGFVAKRRSPLKAVSHRLQFRLGKKLLKLSLRSDLFALGLKPD
jgi:hypothetical protein